MKQDVKYEVVDIEKLPLETVKALLAALVSHLNLECQRREVFYGEPEYRFVSK